MQIITRGIAALVAVVTLAAAMVLGNATAGADPSDPYGPCPGPQPRTSDGCCLNGYGSNFICPGPRYCGPFGCTDGSPSPG